MKRSDMLKIMKDFMDGGRDPFFGQYANEFLTLLEEKGMMPPENGSRIFMNHTEPKYEWEPE